MPTRPRWTPAALLIIAGSSIAFGAGPFPPSFNLSSLNGANGFVLNGIGQSDVSGSSVSRAGDVNGDGVEDVIIGAPNANGVAGESYVVFGGAGVGAGGSFDLDELDGTNGFVINGIDPGDLSGRSVSSAGDVNGDGVDDLIIGAPYADPNGQPDAGESYVVFGGAGVGAGGVLNLSTLNGANGFVLNGIDPSDFGGNSVSGAGDVNGDGVDDLIIGADRADPGGRAQAGESYVVFGGAGVGAGGTLDLSTLNGANGFVINGIDPGDRSGFSVSRAGDVNGDGMGDVIIGAPYASPNGQVQAGESYVVFGRVGLGEGGSLDLSSLNGDNGFVINGIDGVDISGRAVSSAGDVNADGVGDLIIGATRGDPNALNNAGESYVLFGGVGVGAGGSLNLSTLNGANGFVINGVDANDGSGVSVAAAGDVDGDGADDLVIGAGDADPNGQSAAGESYVVFGGPGVGAGGVLELSTLDGSNGLVVNGANAYDSSGDAVASAGDLNGDGVVDMIIGAPIADANGLSSAGRSYVVLGRPKNVWTNSTGGNFDTPGNWLGGAVPTGGLVVIEPTFGITVTGPAGALFIDRLTLGASLGRTALQLQTGSLIGVTNTLDLPDSSAITGQGTLACAAAINADGLITLDGLDVLAGGPLTIGTTGRVEAIEAYIDADLGNQGRLNIDAFTSGAMHSTLEITGPLDNSGEVFVTGDATMYLSGGVTSSGAISFTSSQAIVYGDITNTGVDDGMGGYEPLGVISGSAASDLVLTGDVVNQSSIVLATDSTITLLGSLSGNGITGPGGGAGGEVFIEANFTPGFALATAVASFGGNVSLGSAATTTVRIGGTTPGTDHDQIATLANLAAAGTLNVSLTDAFTPSPGDTYHILEFATATGAFSSVVLDQPLIDAGADISTLLSDGTITIPPPTCAGDIDGDNDTDVFDFALFAPAFGASLGDPGFNPDADLDNNNTIDVFDFAIFAPDFGCAP